MIKTSIQRFIISGRITSKKNSKRVFRTYQGRTVIASSRNHEIWHRRAFFELKEQKPRVMESPVCITIRFTFPDNRKSDLTNKAESIMDLLVDAGILPDDNVSICPKLILKFSGVDKSNSGAEITIECIKQ